MIASYALARALQPEAIATGYAPLRAEALVVEGDAEYNLAKPEAAETYLEAALEAEAAKDDVLAAEAWTDLADEDGSHRADFARAAEHARIADSAIRRAGGDELQRANLLRVQGWLLTSRGTSICGARAR